MSLAYDAHILAAVDGSPLSPGQVVKVTCEDHVQGIHQRIRRRRELHGGHVGRRLRKEDGVTGQGSLLQGGIAVSSKSYLLHATAAKRAQHSRGQ